jgi:hypothetical protein
MNNLSCLKNRVSPKLNLIFKDLCFWRHQWTFGFVGLFAGLIIAAGFYRANEIQAQSFIQNCTPAKTKSFAFTSVKRLANPQVRVTAEVNPSEAVLFVETGLKPQQEPFSGSFDQLFYNDSFLKKFFQFSQPRPSIETAESVPIKLPLSFTRAPPHDL